METAKQFVMIKRRLRNGVEFKLLETKLDESRMHRLATFKSGDAVAQAYEKYKVLWMELDELEKPWIKRQELSAYCVFVRDYPKEFQLYLQKPDNRKFFEMFELVRIWALSVLGDEVRDSETGRVDNDDTDLDNALGGLNFK